MKAERATLSALVQLHCAEYSALTSRNNNWAQIQVGIWTLVLLFLTAAAAVWSTVAGAHPDYVPYIVWGAAAAVQLALAMLYFAMQEVYRNVIYIENILKRQIAGELGGAWFWGYEGFLFRESSRSPVITDAAPFAAAFGALIVTALFRGAFSLTVGIELLGFLTNLLCTTFLGWQCWSAVALRRRFQLVLGQKCR